MIKMKKDPYIVLGVPRNASMDEIKKAYKAKAREFHPDKTKNDPDATEKFKDVQEAFELLRDKKKRANYDRFGHSEGGGPFGAEDFMREFFNPFNFTPGNRPDGASFFRARSVVSYEIACTLAELYSGTTKKVKLRRSSTTLNRPNETVIELKVVAGWSSGTKVTYKGEGDELGATGVAQDVQFVIKELPHPSFVRQGLHLLTKVQIPLVDALCGGSFEVDMLGIKRIPITLEGTACIRPGHKIVVPGEGMPNPRLGRPPGDLIVEFDVLFPQRLTPEQQSKLKEVLAPENNNNDKPTAKL